jgi:Protein of unknown function (DUF3151)
MSQNLLGEPPATLLPDDSSAREALAGGTDAATVAAHHPAYPGAWAALAERALSDGDPVAAYAYARAGYHRGLDALRRSGWKGHGPVPWSHEPNQGWLRCLHALGQAAGAIGEDDEAHRCATFLRESSAEAAAVLSQPGGTV